MDSEVDASVCDDNVSALAECSDDRCRGREVLRIKNAILCSEELGDVLLKLRVYICQTFELTPKNDMKKISRRVLTKRPIESRRTTAAETVFPQGFDGPFLDVLVASEAGKVEAGEINDGLSCAEELGLGSIGTLNNGNGIIVTLFGRIKRHGKRFGIPLVNEFVDFL